MTERLRQQLAELLRTWQAAAPPLTSIRGTMDDYERGYRTGFARAMNKCADELRQLLAQTGEGSTLE